MDKKEGFVVPRLLPSSLETATVIDEEAQVTSLFQQGIWKRPKWLFCCVCCAACPEGSELLYPLRSA